MWVNSQVGGPRIAGHLEISKRRAGIFIGGDPDGLRSLARLLNWLADADQEAHPSMPDGERWHVHLHADDPVRAFNSLTPFSAETEICRLDGKGTGVFPDKYYTANSEKAKRCRGIPRLPKAKKMTKGGKKTRATKTTKTPTV